MIVCQPHNLVCGIYTTVAILYHRETHCQLDHRSQVCAYLKRPGARLPGSVCFTMVPKVEITP